MRLIAQSDTVTSPYRKYFRITVEEYSLLMKVREYVAQFFFLAASSSDIKSGPLRIPCRSSRTVISLRQWKALAKVHLAEYRIFERWNGYKLKSRQEGSSIKIDWEDVVALSEGRFTFKEYHYMYTKTEGSIEDARKEVRTQAARSRAGRKGGSCSKGKPKLGTFRKSASTEGTNENLKPWIKEGLSRTAWYAKRRSEREKHGLGLTPI